MATRTSKGRNRKGKRAQSAMEYLTTYGWAILIVAIVVAILYFYTSVPSNIVNNSCTFVSGAYCNDMIIGTNTMTPDTSA